MRSEPNRVPQMDGTFFGQVTLAEEKRILEQVKLDLLRSQVRLRLAHGHPIVTTIEGAVAQRGAGALRYLEIIEAEVDDLIADQEVTHGRREGSSLSV